ncbi:hypothetical protein [Catenuloplanes atrovinosus]|uniref:Uncharacterized protein n=1 Tax=Catenuloplanes atrovinosus TaxID=137266 RepID=A0AAE3YJ21_9ACTN|nr:hypothetical protein [Catenuloplanes atrovinosus]MDR7274684.1 hypothetical protein [Catenuloplanes atrovinosus]
MAAAGAAAVLAAAVISPVSPAPADDPFALACPMRDDAQLELIAEEAALVRPGVAGPGTSPIERYIADRWSAGAPVDDSWYPAGGDAGPVDPDSGDADSWESDPVDGDVWEPDSDDSGVWDEETGDADVRAPDGGDAGGTGESWDAGSPGVLGPDDLVVGASTTTETDAAPSEVESRVACAVAIGPAVRAGVVVTNGHREVTAWTLIPKARDGRITDGPATLP